MGSKNEGQGNHRQIPKPRTIRSRNVSINVAFLWKLHAEGEQFREGPNGRHSKRPENKWSPEETLDGLHTGGYRQ